MKEFMTLKQIKKQAARYVKYVEWSDEDHCFVGRCPEVFSGAVHGSDEVRVYAELCETVEEWIELLHTDGVPLPEPLSRQKDFSGKFVLRVEPALHRRLAAKAFASGESLNSFCMKALVKA
jgi:predicted HicB family RNase H-like nuclease